MKKVYGLASAIAAAALFGTLVMAADRKPPEQSGRPVVVELFTSQGCYSCPPAEAFLGELAERSDVIALEFHVDYWDDLVYGAAGKWKDPFSSPMATQRQRLYAHTFGTGRIYTPQMVVDGHLQAVGSNRLKIFSAIGKAKERGDHEVVLDTTRDGSGNLTLEIEAPSSTSTDLWLVTFTQTKTTKVLSGENKGKTLVSHNIVKDLIKLESWGGGTGMVTIPSDTMADAEGCAIIAQASRLGPIAGATYCPALES